MKDRLSNREIIPLICCPHRLVEEDTRLNKRMQGMRSTITKTMKMKRRMSMTRTKMKKKKKKRRLAIILRKPLTIIKSLIKEECLLINKYNNNYKNSLQ